MATDDKDVRWLVLIFLGKASEVPPASLARLRELGLVEDRETGLAITPRGHEAVADFQRRLG
jgi:hypothetical protein